MPTDPTPTPADIEAAERAPLVPYVAPALDPWLTRAARAVGMVDAGDLAEFAVRVERLGVTAREEGRAESAERIAALEEDRKRIGIFLRSFECTSYDLTLSDFAESIETGAFEALFEGGSLPSPAAPPVAGTTFARAALPRTGGAS